MPRISWRSAALLAFLVVGAVACGDDHPSPLATGDPAGLSNDLQSNLLNWPAEPFTPERTATYVPYLQPGDRAVDFTLTDVGTGRDVTLSKLLKDKPVLLITGSYTCPVYQRNIEGLNMLAMSVADDDPSDDHPVHFVHVYVVEAHPKAPDPAPHFGEVSELRYSSLPQARTYRERLTNALEMAPRIRGNQRLLLDDLTPGLNNPVWSTYGSGANSAFLIDTDGTILLAQTWTDVDALRAELVKLATPE